MMETAVSSGMCRCCASEGLFKDVNTTYRWMGNDEVYADMLQFCFDITLSTAEEDNGGICEVCITQLRNAANFKKQVQHTEEQFKKIQEERAFKPELVKVEMSIDDGLNSDNNLSEDYHSGAEFEVPIKEESPEPKPRKRAAKATTSRAKKTKLDSGETSTKRLTKNEIVNFERTSESETKYDLEEELDKSPERERLDAMESSSTLDEIPIKHGEELEKHRTNVREILLWSNATPIRCKGGIGYACGFCTEQFTNPSDLKKHSMEDHNKSDISIFMKGRDMHGYLVKLDITALSCKICSIPTQSLEQMMRHLKTVHSKSIDLNIKNHMIPFKFDTESLQCCICSTVFHKFQALQVHMNNHYRNYVCDVCDAGFVNRHMLRCHGNGHKTGNFPCDQCSKVFKTLRMRKLHERIVHGCSLPHKCGHCNQRFKENWNKNEHLAKVHGIRTPGVQCQACEKTFDSQQRWLLHMKRDHLMQRQHQCTRCDKAFYAKRELTDHMVKHTGLREFECEACPKSYGRLKTLKEHIRRLHPDDDRFRCNYCGWIFAQNALLKRHVNSKHVDIF